MKGEKNNRSILTEDLVKTLREEYYDEGYTFLALSYKYGYNQQTIRNAVRGISWSHVNYYLNRNKKKHVK